MSKIVWDAAGAHFYETGVSKGVLYPADATASTTHYFGEGVAWNGLSSVSESPEGAEISAIYADNRKYLNLMSAEEFKATIEAYTYPDEFAECDGSKELKADGGVFVNQQTRKNFCLCYQTKIGNDVNPDLGYKIHIVYNALAAPTDRAYETVNDSPEAMTFSWEISTTPVEIAGFKESAHLVIDSTKCTAAKLTLIENALYGTDGVSPAAGTAPKILFPDEILAILNQQ